MNSLQLLTESGFFWQDRIKGFARRNDHVLTLWYRLPNELVAEKELVQIAKSLLRIVSSKADGGGFFTVEKDHHPLAVHVHFNQWPHDLKPMFMREESVH
ncbi:hypothetical protein [Sulfobacillus thermosulfidooxidans]|uniref:hypothetical protein n=1 Tax=Sulfobacillus thermosulfidooxidans TaxID=28034 RepID=UPI0006B40EE1|nr:hypothetical protein [Sulfobacillus thermosulfidooxidans]